MVQKGPGGHTVSDRESKTEERREVDTTPGSVVRICSGTGSPVIKGKVDPSLRREERVCLDPTCVDPRSPTPSPEK